MKNVGWRRIAAGLNQALGLVVADDVVFMLCGDQLTRLDDTNGDGETDFYACVTNRFQPSGGHNFKCGLERDEKGNFFTASHQGLLRISPDGKTVDVLAVGFRNPDGLGLLPDGTLTVPVSEGEWTPASAICAVRRQPGEKLALSFVNPDVVPHNWVLVKPGALETVGTLADALIADPEAVARHYVPKSDDVVAYADITSPGARQTIFFTVPDAPGRYPFLCTFPGHWKLMNGVMIVGE